jgi:hypothetical protein
VHHQSALGTVAVASGKILIGCVLATGAFMWGGSYGWTLPRLGDIPAVYGIGLLAWGPYAAIFWIIATAVIAVLRSSKIVRAVKQVPYWVYLIVGTIAGWVGGVTVALTTGHGFYI